MKKSKIISVLIAACVLSACSAKTSFQSNNGEIELKVNKNKPIAVVNNTSQIYSTTSFGQYVFKASRITSYNVCYTKLLRSDLNHAQIAFATYGDIGGPALEDHGLALTAAGAFGEDQDGVPTGQAFLTIGKQAVSLTVDQVTGRADYAADKRVGEQGSLH